MNQPLQQKLLYKVEGYPRTLNEWQHFIYVYFSLYISHLVFLWSHNEQLSDMFPKII